MLELESGMRTVTASPESTISAASVCKVSFDRTVAAKIHTLHVHSFLKWRECVMNQEQLTLNGVERHRDAER